MQELTIYIVTFHTIHPKTIEAPCCCLKHTNIYIWFCTKYNQQIKRRPVDLLLKLMRSESQRIPQLSREPNCHTLFIISSPLHSILSQRTPVHAHMSLFFRYVFNIILFYVQITQVVSCLQVSRLKFRTNLPCNACAIHIPNLSFFPIILLIFGE
jgi:hypothetical protein